PHYPVLPPFPTRRSSDLQDVLAFTSQFGITGNFNAVTGVLALSGSASPANYQAVLHSVTYANSSQNPSTATRTITFKVNDGALRSEEHTSELQSRSDLVC